MRVIGLGWEYLSTQCSKNVNSFTPEELASHIKMIVSKQRSRSTPSKLPFLLPVQKSLPQLSTQEPDIFTMNESHLETNDEFEHHSIRTIL